MLLTISTTHRPATDMGYLLHKNPARPQALELAFCSAHAFYPEAKPQRCTAALPLDIDQSEAGPRPRRGAHRLRQRPPLRFPLVALGRNGARVRHGDERPRQGAPAVGRAPIPLEAALTAVPCSGARTLGEDLFGPLGDEVETATDPEEERAPYRNVRLRATKTLAPQSAIEGIAHHGSKRPI